MKLLLIDGHYYVYRSFFAIPNLSNSKGEPTNAIFGFTKTLRLMIKHLQPELGAVFWDEGLPEKRMTLQPAYKETRKEMPQPMIPQLDYIQNELTALLGFKNISLPNTEADDLMGCYAIAACKKNIEVILATNDKDLYQLVGPCVKVYTTAKADLVSPKDAFALLGESEVTTKWGVPPSLIGDVLALSGDSVDNIPSAGFGRKTAAKLLMEHGNLDGLLANVELATDGSPVMSGRIPDPRFTLPLSGSRGCSPHLPFLPRVAGPMPPAPRRPPLRPPPFLPPIRSAPPPSRVDGTSAWRCSLMICRSSLTTRR